MTEPLPLRRNLRFQSLWLGAATSELGSTLTWLAFPLLILSVTGSAAVAGLTGACRITTNLLMSLPAGVWVDRWNRRRILIACEAVRCLSLAALALAIFADQVALWQIILVAVLNGSADAFFGPARATAIRAVVPAEQLPTAYAQEEARSHAASLAGPPLGGFLFGLGRVFPFVVDALSYLLSMLFVIAAKVPARPEADPAPAESSGGSSGGSSSGSAEGTDEEPGARPKARMRADVAEAARWLWRQRGLRAGLAFSLISNLVANALLLPVIVLIEERGGDSTGTGFVLAAMGLGGLLGATVSARIGRLLPPGRLMLVVVGFFALAVCATTLPFGRYWPGVPLCLAMVAVPALNVVLQVVVATLVPDAMMGRLVSLFSMASMGLAPLGPVLGGTLAQYVGGVGALLAIGGTLTATCVVAALGPSLRGLNVPTAPGAPATGEADEAAGGPGSEPPDPVQLGREPVS
jgi:MFS family permease